MPILSAFAGSTWVLSGVAREESGAASGLLQTIQQVGGTVGLAIVVTIFGSASRRAAADPLVGVAAPGRQILAHGVASAFMAGAIFAACLLLVAVFAIRAPTAKAPAVSLAGVDDLAA